MLIPAIGVLWLAGFVLLELFWPWQGTTPAQLILQCFLALALGIGLTSCHFFVWLTVVGRPDGFIWSEIVVTLVLGGMLLFTRHRRSQRVPNEIAASSGPKFKLEWMIAGTFVVVIVCACIISFLLLARQPHGRYDAVAMWNAKARIIFRGGGDWTGATSSYLPHPDYPLLLPLSVARGWSYLSREPQVVPSLLALLFTFGSAAVLVSSVAVLRSRAQGMLAGIVLFGPFTYLTFGVSQHADFPLAFFVLCTLVFFCLHERAPPGNRSLLIMAGLTAGFAAWTKNEGLLFVFVVVVVRAAIRVHAKGLRACFRELGYVASGLLPVLLLLAFFKSQVDLPNDLVAAQDLSSVSRKVVDISRYKLIGKAVVTQLLFFGAWQPSPIYLLALYPFVVGSTVVERDRSGVLTASAVLGLLFVGYLVTYLLTPRDLEWHLYTSLDRLLLQLWPAGVFLYFMIVRTPEEALAQP